MKRVPTGIVKLTLNEIIEIECALQIHWQPDERMPMTADQKKWCAALSKKLDVAKGPLTDRKRQQELRRTGALKCPRCGRYMGVAHVRREWRWECFKPEGCGKILPKNDCEAYVTTRRL